MVPVLAVNLNPNDIGFGGSRDSEYKVTSLIRNTQPPRITLGP